MKNKFASSFRLVFLVLIINFHYLNAQDDTSKLDYIHQIENEIFQGNTQFSLELIKKAIEYYKGNNSKLSVIYNFSSKAQNSIAQFNEAKISAEEALKLSKLSNNKTEEANAYDNIGHIYLSTGNYEKAKDNFINALTVRQDNLNSNYYLSTSQLNLGIVFQRMGNFEESYIYLKKALEYKLKDSQKNNILKADIHQNIGYIQYNKAEFNKALISFENTLSLAKKVFKNETPYFVRIYNDLGLVYSIKEHFNESLKYYQKALSVSIKHFGLDQHPDQIRIHFNIGTIYRKQNSKEQALHHTKKCLDMALKVFGDDHMNLFYPYSQIGQIYGDERGVPYIKKALEICKKMKSGSEIRISFLQDYLYEIYFRIGKYNEALASAKESLNIRLNLFGESNGNTIRSYDLISKAYLLLGDYENSREYNQKSINANYVPNDKHNIIDDEFKIINYINTDLLLESIKQSADISLELYLQQNDKANLIRSNKFYNKASELISLLRNKQRNYEDKIKFSAITKSVYTKSIQSNFLLSKLENDNTYLISSFYNSEKSRANVLRELANNTEAKKISNIDDITLNLEKSIDTKIASLYSEVLRETSNEKTDSTKLYSIEGEISDLVRKKDSIEKRIEENHPKYYKLKYDKSIVTIEDIQNEIDENSTLIEFSYFSNHLYAFIITKNTFNVEEIITKNLEHEVESFNSHITNDNHNGFLEKSFQLYSQIIKPIEKHFTGDQLIIIPDEFLWHLQFDLLITKKSEKPSYLLYNYAISYANSASLLFDQDFSTRKDLLDECIAFSYTNSDSKAIDSDFISLKKFRDAKNDLPGTRKEIKELSKIFDGAYFYGNNADEFNFKENAHNYKLIHLALHAEIDSINPSNLKILFSKTQNQSQEDNKLYGHEIYTLDIPADLVVLSACNTGVGKINKGEGILSLGNAFQYAGAKSLLLSRWKISDETTPELMKYFYENISNGMTKSKALQQAKIDFLANANYFESKPKYWGSFYILGDSKVLELNSSFQSIHLYIIVILVLVLITLILLQKKRNKNG